MYLKRVEALGFKSFAQKVNVEFSPQINGIVGPNGCGKSNVTDAIKWVLGEQSSKNLRASSMSDIIFSGSQDYKKQNFAQVTLVFDNSDHTLPLDFNEVEITRRLYRNGDSEYLINKSNARLKDVVELLLDTGLGKDSLSMISQGAIANFAQAKPIERRAIFEEAAGVAKYKKRKFESLKKLDKVNENLLRLSDIVSELEIQLNPLKKQAEKAKIYLNKKSELEEIEVSVIVHEVDILNQSLHDLKTQLEENRVLITSNDAQLQIDENKIDNLKTNLNKYDKLISELQNQLMANNEEILKLEKENYQAKLFEPVVEEDELKRMQYELDELNIQVSALKNNLNSFNEELSVLRVQYQEKKNINDNLAEEITSLKQNHTNLTYQKQTLENQLHQKANLYSGVKAILDTKDSLNGIVGIVNDLFEFDDQYEEALNKAMANSLQNIVVESSDDAQKAINFLKANKAGRATFMPMDLLNPRNINENDLYLANTIDGFIDIATNLIEFDSQYNIVFEYLLNTTLITKDLDSAIKLAKLLNNKYKIVSIDGEVISVGGIISGGNKHNDRNALLSQKKQLSSYDIKLEEINVQLTSKQNIFYQQESELSQLLANINNLNINHAKIEANYQLKDKQFKDLKDKYEQLSNDDYQVVEDELSKMMNIALQTKERLIIEINTNQQSRINLHEELNDLEISFKALQKENNHLRENNNLLNVEKTKKEISLKSYLDHLALEYSLTIDSAKQSCLDLVDIASASSRVKELKQDIKGLGIVNVLAIEEYDKLLERYDFITSQSNDLQESKSELIQMLAETDKIMIEKFSQTIDDINQELPITFKKLFGGGHASLQYSDPSDLLETGIEIIANPPGKSVQNLNLFSGGEKALIALSVLFAILKARPIPICILDEVEAALDQANVERFARYLKEFSEQTQFIVITHRPGTMEQCDILYGVTMQEKGVSKLVGVHLEQAQQLIER